ncbi:DUF6891 domain-containing protein [Streptacidiphilus fuscans]|uniref:DUF6891 domain-containing protein n=1 Tax=Streptacidiphilus fuscans TaxID=2789292 RepID=A0A931B464_9ACTN|nr:hypothetical protein [Streptacidiphilus fuscans]MBF9069999.1 hypothetical protein [Streptacidiphilus fuscans]
MLPVSVYTERTARLLRPTAEALGALVRGIGDPGDRFLVAGRVPDLPDVYFQIWHENGGDYTVEHRDGAPVRHFRTRLPDAEQVVAALFGWARVQDTWDTGLSWERLEDWDEAPPVPPLELPEEDLRALEDCLRGLLTCGYVTLEQLTETAEDYLVDDGVRPVSGPQAAALANRLWRERVAEQTSWVGETDPERITRAFDALEERGITAREHFTCCRSCGQAEIGAEAEPGSRGFVYFHSQSAEGAASGGALHLHYGGFDGSEQTTRGIGAEVVAALEQVGLSPEWEGDPSQAVLLPSLDWRKRLVG